jgi:hypothetical protein
MIESWRVAPKGKVMLRVDKHSARLAATALLALTLAACGAQGAAQPTAAPPTAAPTEAAPPPTEGPATPAPATPTAEPTVAPPVAPTAAPTTAAPEPAAPPAVVYIDQGSVIARSGVDDLVQLATLPEGALGGALLGEDTLLVLTESGIERVQLADGATEQVMSFDRPVIFGAFRVYDGTVLYDVKVSEPESVTPFGTGTRIGVYDRATGAARQILAEPSSLELLGPASGADAILTLPRGQDPAFGEIQVRSLSDGAVRERLEVPGEGYAIVSPDGRWAAVSSRRYDGGEGAGVDELRLYDLTARPVTSRLVTLPQPGAATSGVWAANGSGFFFSYGPGNLYELSGSYGLWRLDPQTLEVSQVAGVDVQNTRIDGISPGGFVLLRGLTTGEAALVDTASGAWSATVVPPSAFVAGWR